MEDDDDDDDGGGDVPGGGVVPVTLSLPTLSVRRWSARRVQPGQCRALTMPGPVQSAGHWYTSISEKIEQQNFNLLVGENQNSNLSEISCRSNYSGYNLLRWCEVEQCPAVKLGKYQSAG